MLYNHRLHMLELLLLIRNCVLMQGFQHKYCNHSLDKYNIHSNQFRYMLELLRQHVPKLVGVNTILVQTVVTVLMLKSLH